jgi:tetratricopeptide (TPR) repeat protein
MNRLTLTGISVAGLSLSLIVPLSAQSITPSEARLLTPEQHVEVARNTVAEVESRPIPAPLDEHVYALCLLAEALTAAGEFTEAKETLVRAEAESNQLAPSERANRLTNVRLVEAQLLAAQGSFSLAETTLRRLLASSITPSEAIRTIRMRLVWVLSQSNQQAAVEAELAAWRASPESANDQELLMMIYNNQMALKSWNDAQMTALRILELARDQVETAVGRLSLAGAYSNAGRHEDAEREIRLAGEILATLDSQSPPIVMLKKLGVQSAMMVAWRAKDFERVVTLYEKNGDFEDPMQAWMIFVANVDLERFPEAIMHGERYLELLKSNFQFHQLVSKALAHYLLAFVNLRQLDHEKAKRELDIGLDCEAQNYDQLSASGIDDAVFFRDSVTQADPVALAASLGDPRLVERALFITQGFVYASLARKTAYSMKKSALSERLFDGECLLALFEYNDLTTPSLDSSNPVKLAGAIIVRSGIPTAFLQLGLSKPIAENIEVFYQSLEREDDESEDKMIGALAILYELTVQTIEKENTISETVIYYGDGFFGSLPFHLLWNRGKFQIEERDIAYLPFLRALNRDGIAYSSDPSVIVGNAIYDPQHALPAAAIECKTVAKVWAEYNINTGELLEGEKAKTPAVLQIKSPAYLHVVAHGFAQFALEQDWPDPRLRLQEQLNSSCLVLSKSPDGNGTWADQNYHLLTGSNIVGCDFSGTRCVVLHACRSGVGTPSGREGSIGLVTALLSTGPHRAILSHWNILDEFAPQVAGELYESAVLRFDGTRDIQLFSAFQRKALKIMQEDHSAWKAVRSSGALYLYLGCR